jgi:hypothetical protein
MFGIRTAEVLCPFPVCLTKEDEMNYVKPIVASVLAIALLTGVYLLVKPRSSCQMLHKALGVRAEMEYAIRRVENKFNVRVPYSAGVYRIVKRTLRYCPPSLYNGHYHVSKALRYLHDDMGQISKYLDKWPEGKKLKAHLQRDIKDLEEWVKPKML